jgi:replicative DNA helicase
MNTFEDLDATCKKLVTKIDLAEREDNYDDLIKYKKQYHEIKLEMISLIEKEDKPTGITARELIADVSSRKNVPRYETGVAPLDRKLNGGFEVGSLVQIGAQSFAGKTHLSIEILANISEYKEVVFFNFEMGDVRMSRRLKELLKTDKQLDNFIVDSKSRHIDSLINEIKIYAHKGIKFFSIDSKMKVETDELDELKSHSIITNRLSKTAQTLDVIIMLINQMSEESIKNKRLAFKGSGDQMYDTDIALFYIVDEKNPEQRVLICSKNRQDEKTFKIKTRLDHNGKTVDADEVQYVHETISYETPDSAYSMPVVGA